MYNNNEILCLMTDYAKISEFTKGVILMKKKITALFLAALFMTAAITGALAAPTAKTQSTEAPVSQETEGNDTQQSTESVSQNETSVSTAGNGIFIEDDTMTPPNVDNSKAALLMDMNSGRLLYGKNIDERVFPASTTKIMTGILAIEMGNFSDVVTASRQAIEPITLEDSHMGIYIGEQLTFEQLVTSMLVYSANDAANVIAVHLSGSIDEFVNIMNQKAQELGMTNTHFANPCGSHNDDHYTTAHDLAILAQYAMQNETFREIVKMPIYKIAPTEKYTEERILVNTNLFLGTSRSVSHYYPLCTGIKTGHTSQSGYCLVSSAVYEDMYLLAIVMGCPNEDVDDKAYSYIDSRSLFDFGFNNYIGQVIATPGDIVSDSKVFEAKGGTRVALTVETPVNALIPSTTENLEDIETKINLTSELKAPITKGDVLGSVIYSYRGTQIGSANLIATNNVERNAVLHVINLIIKIVLSPFFFIPVILILMLLIIADNKRKKRARQKRIQQLKKQRQRTPDRNAVRNERIENETKGSNSRYNR